MKKYIICLLILLFSLNIFAKTKQNQLLGYKSGYFTFSGSYLDYDFAPINDGLKDFLGKNYSDGLYLFGGSLSADVGSGVSLGFQFKYGSKELSGISKQDFEGETLSLARNNDFILSYYGLNLEYKRALGGAFQFFGRVSANLGSVDLNISQKESSMSFADLYDSFDPGDPNGLNRGISYSSDLYLFETMAGLRFFIREGVSLEISSGYLYGFSEDKGDFNYGFDNVYNASDFDFEHMIYELSLSFGK